MSPLPPRTYGRYTKLHLVHHRVRPPLLLLPPYPYSLILPPSANRGIGLKLTKQLLESPANTVLAACRDPAKADALNALARTAPGRVHVLPLEITDRESVKDAARAVREIVGEPGLDYLINNAAIVRPPPSLYRFRVRVADKEGARPGHARRTWRSGTRRPPSSGR